MVPSPGAVAAPSASDSRALPDAPTTAGVSVAVRTGSADGPGRATASGTRWAGPASDEIEIQPPATPVPADGAATRTATGSVATACGASTNRAGSMAAVR